MWDEKCWVCYILIIIYLYYYLNYFVGRAVEPYKACQFYWKSRIYSKRKCNCDYLFWLTVFYLQM